MEKAKGSGLISRACSGMMKSFLSQMCSSSYSLCSNLSSTWSLIDNPTGLTTGLVDALGGSVIPFPGDSAIQSMVSICA